MPIHKLNLVVPSYTLAICRLERHDPLPSWTAQSLFVSITRTDDELSVVCDQEVVSESVKCDQDWRCFKVQGPLPFGLIGVVASIVDPLAEAGISIFALSTYDTDYVLVKAENLDKSIEALMQVGHQITVE